MKKMLQKEKVPALAPLLDEKDLAILKLLQQNARITVREISDAIHLSTTPVHERIKRMEDAGVIKQYATLLDHSKVKRGLMVICYVSLRQHNKTAGAKFIKAIMEMNEVMECYNISAAFDFMLKVLVENMAAYYNFQLKSLSEAKN